MKGLKRTLLLAGMALAAVSPAWAADYVFMYDGGYLYVTNTGAVGYTTTFSRSCVWTCVSNTTSLTAATLGTTSRYLYTEVNGTRYWLVGSTTNGTAVSVTTTAPGTAYWRNDGDNLYYYSSYNYYLYYRGSSWRTSRSSSTSWTNRNNNNYYEGYYGDYRSTTTAGTSVAQQVTGYTVTTVDITPSAAQTVEYNGSLSYTAAATATQTVIPAHTTFTIGGYYGTTYHFYNNQLSTNANDFAFDNPVTPTYTWSLSGDGANGLELMSTNGENTIVRYTGSASGTTATLTVTAKAGTATSTASVTINVTPVEPTAISATDATVYVGSSGEVVYTLTPNYAYNRVAAVSGDAGVFTAASPATGGTVAVTPVAPGQATLTLTALNSDGSDGPSTTATVTVRDICAAPEFSFEQSGSSVVATLTCATPGATIRYTTDGTDPTPTTGTVYTGPFASANGQTIKAIAVLGDYYDASEIVTKNVNPIDYVEQGVSGGIVTINDLEDHRWSYYQSSGNLPTGYPTTYLSSPDPRNVKLTYMRGKVSGASEVAISAIEGDTMMVYYMTREKSVPGMTGDYPYTVISNPYSKRPRTTGSTGTNGFYGFAGWKVISGGEYISEYNNGATIPLDATIHFTNFDTYDTNAISADIVLQATWTAATVTRSASAPTFSGGTYETNFWVLSGNPSAAVTVPANSTMTARYPDGTSSWDGNFTRTITAGGNNAKVEWVNMNSTADVTASNYTFTMGRGIVNSGNGGKLSGASQNANANQTVKIESGTYNTLFNFTNGLNAARTCDQLLILGCDYDRAKNDNTKLIVRGNMYVGQGVQLNRAANSLYTRTYIKSGNFGSTVNVSGNSGYTGAGGTNTYYYSVTNTHNTGRRYLCMEGGRIDGIAGGMDETNAQTSTVRAFDLRVRGNAQIDGVVYGAAEFANGKGIRTMVFTGGTVNGWVAGGANGTQSTNGALTGSSYVYMGGTAKVESDNHTQVMNRAVGGNVFGAGCGYSTSSSSGQVTVETNVVLADEAYVERGVYGGGSYGYTTATANLYILGGTVGGQPGGVNGTTYSANITGGVFGGACQNQGGTVNIYMNGGLVQGGVYGGSNASGNISNNVTMQINGGQVGTSTQFANIHGGGYGSATVVSGNVEVTLGQSGQTTDGVTVYGDVYGGSALGSVNGTSANTTYHTYVTLNKGTINGSLYGGALGNAGTAANVYGPVAVKVYGGSVNTTSVSGSGAVYGCNNISGAPQRAVTVDIYGTDAHPGDGTYAIDAVYGGGNQAEYTYSTPNVTVHNCTPSIGDVYGGGNAARVPSTNVKIYGGNTIGNVYAGGNGTGKDANFTMVTGNAVAYIYGGTIKRVFPGNNSSGIIGGTKTVHVDASASDDDSDPAVSGDHCALQVGALFGGGNQADGTRGVWDITCTGSSSEGIDTLFGGANNANITDASYTMTVNGGNIRKAIFGGNNAGGTVQSNITINVLKSTKASTATCYQPDSYPTVFGGGFGENTETAGNVTVNIGDSTSTTTAPTIRATFAGGAVYGGSALGKVNGSTSNTTTVNINNGTIYGSVYGGGLGMKVASGNYDAGTYSVSDSTAAIVRGNSVVNIGTYTQQKGTYSSAVSIVKLNDVDSGYVFGGNNLCGSAMGNTTVHIWATAHTTDNLAPSQTGTPDVDEIADDPVLNATSDNFALKAIYGGGNLAHYKASGKKATVHIHGCDNTVEYVYGGGNAANVPACETTIEGGHFYMVFGGGNGEVDSLPGANITEGDATTNVYGGVFHSIFGGSNTKGSIAGDMNLTVDQSSGSCGLEVVGNLYGGGNRAESKSGNLTVECGQIVLGNVYGGANAAGVTGDVTLTMKGGEIDSVFAGNNQSGVIGGNVVLNLRGGTIRNAFGGNNAGGNILGSITVNIDSLASLDADCRLKVDNVYGGGNKAAYAPTDATAATPHVKLLNGTVRNTVFGGGLGEAATVAANPKVTIGNGTKHTVVGDTMIDGGAGDGNVFGGGSQAAVIKSGSNGGNTHVELTGNAEVKGNVYGGGNQADVEGDTKVELK